MLSRKLIHFWWLLVLVLMAGCQGEARSPGVSGLIHKELTYQHRARYYLQAIPKKAEPGHGYTLVVMLHGGLGNPERFAQATGFPGETLRHPTVVVYPAGSGRFSDRLLTWNAGVCCGYAQRENVDDVGFIDKVIEQVTSEYPIDPDRVFVVGHSNGGMMAYRMACERSAIVDGIGVVGGTMNFSSKRCRPDRPVTVVSIHGEADQNVPIQGGMGEKSRAGVSHRSIIETLSIWRSYDECEAQPAHQETRVASIDSYRCKSGRKVVDVRVHDGPHKWNMDGLYDVNAVLLQEFGLSTLSAQLEGIARP